MKPKLTIDERKRLSDEKLITKELKLAKRIAAKAEKFRLKQLELKPKMNRIMINTLDGKQTLLHLSETVGVRNRVRYFNNTESGKKVFDRGLIFNDGFEIRGVDASCVNYTNAPIIEKRERIPNFKTYPATLPFD